MITSYTEKVKRVRGGSSLIAYWPMNERSGTTALDHSTNGYNGTTSSVGVADWYQIGPDGGHCYYFNGTSSYLNVYAAQPKQPTTIGTAMIWIAAQKNYLDSTTTGRILTLAVDADNIIHIEKTSTANTFDLSYEAATTQDKVSPTIYAQDGNQWPEWHQLVLTWTAAGDAVKVYVDGAQSGTTQTSLGTWVGDMASTLMVIGADNTTVTSVWSGWLAHCALWSVVLSDAEIADLAKIGP